MGENIAETALRRLEKEICSEARRRSMEHAEAREEFELEQVVSCGLGDQGGRRTKLDLGSGESFDDLHRSTAFWTAPKIT